MTQRTGKADSDYGGANGPYSSLVIYARDVARTPLLSAAEELLVVARVAEGDSAAKDLLIRANLSLVIDLAKHMNRGADIMDLIQAGNYGLVYAVSKFDPAHGVRFNTYAGYWIKKEIRHEINRLPIVHVTNNAFELIEEVNRQADPAGYLDTLSTHDQAIYQRGCEGVESTSTAAHFGHYEQSDLFHPSSREPDPSADLAGNQERREHAIEALPERLRDIVVSHYGLGIDEPQSLADIGREMGLTRERVRQLNEKAEEKLRQEFERQGIEYEDVE